MEAVSKDFRASWLRFVEGPSAQVVATTVNQVPTYNCSRVLRLRGTWKTGTFEVPWNGEKTEQDNM